MFLKLCPQKFPYAFLNSPILTTNLTHSSFTDISDWGGSNLIHLKNVLVDSPNSIQIHEEGYEKVVANVQIGLSISLPLLLDSAWHNVLLPLPEGFQLSSTS